MIANAMAALDSLNSTNVSDAVLSASSALELASEQIGSPSDPAGREAGRQASDAISTLLGALQLGVRDGTSDMNANGSTAVAQALTSIGASLSNLLETTAPSVTGNLSAEESAYLDNVGQAALTSLNTLMGVALHGAPAGSTFDITTAAFGLKASRDRASALSETVWTATIPDTSGRRLLGSQRASDPPRFRVPASVFELPSLTNVSVVDVRVVAFDADLFAHHQSYARAVSKPLELSLSAVDTITMGSSPVNVQGLSEDTPIQIELPITSLLSEADDNPYRGARCGEGNRSECEAELRVLNATALAQVAECEQVQNDVFSIFDQRGAADCLSLAHSAQEAVRRKQDICNELEVLPCSGRGSCSPDGTCVCDGPYYGFTCGRVLECTWWDGASYTAEGCRAMRVRRSSDGSDRGVLECECTHLTLFEALYDIEWGDVAIYSTLGWPMASLPLSKWGELWDNLGKLHWTAWLMMASVILVLTILLLWARHMDNKAEYVAYMPKWYQQVRRVERAARHSRSCWKRMSSWPLLVFLWFVTNHPWIVVFLVKPSDELKHAHLVMLLFNMLLAELCFFLVFYGYEQSPGAGAVAILIDEGGKWVMLLCFQALFTWAMREPEIQTLEAEDAEGWCLVFRQTAPFVWPAGRVNLCEFDFLSDNFSKLEELESYRDPATGEFTFKLAWPNRDHPPATWVQTSNPLIDDTAEGFQVLQAREQRMRDGTYRSIPLVRSPEPDKALIVGGSKAHGDGMYYLIGHRLLRSALSSRSTFRSTRSSFGAAKSLSMKSTTRSRAGTSSTLSRARCPASLGVTAVTGCAAQDNDNDNQAVEDEEEEEEELGLMPAQTMLDAVLRRGQLPSRVIELYVKNPNHDRSDANRSCGQRCEKVRQRATEFVALRDRQLASHHALERFAPRPYKKDVVIQKSGPRNTRRALVAVQPNWLLQYPDGRVAFFAHATNPQDPPTWVPVIRLSRSREAGMNMRLLRRTTNGRDARRTHVVDRHASED